MFLCSENEGQNSSFCFVYVCEILLKRIRPFVSSAAKVTLIDTVTSLGYVHVREILVYRNDQETMVTEMIRKSRNKSNQENTMWMALWFTIEPLFVNRPLAVFTGSHPGGATPPLEWTCVVEPSNVYSRQCDKEKERNGKINCRWESRLLRYLQEDHSYASRPETETWFYLFFFFLLFA